MRQLDLILEANRRFLSGRGFRGVQRTPRPARQLLILTCMDARLDLFRVLGLAVGDAHILRNAGGRVTDDSLRSIALSTKVLGTKEVGVIHHDDCGLQGRTNEELQRVAGVAIDFLPFEDVQTSVAEDVAALRRCDWLGSDVVVWGAVYDVDTHALRVVTPA